MGTEDKEEVKDLTKMARVFMTFIELELRGDYWHEELPMFLAKDLINQNLANARVFRAMGDDCDLLVEPEVVMRKLLIRKGATIAVQGSMVILDKDFITEELSVDEDLRAGKRLKLT